MVLFVNGAEFQGQISYDAEQKKAVFTIPSSLPSGMDCELVLKSLIQAENGNPIRWTRVRFRSPRPGDPAVPDSAEVLVGRPHENATQPRVDGPPSSLPTEPGPAPDPTDETLLVRTQPELNGLLREFDKACVVWIQLTKNDVDESP